MAGAKEGNPCVLSCLVSKQNHSKLKNCPPPLLEPRETGRFSPCGALPRRWPGEDLPDEAALEVRLIRLVPVLVARDPAGRREENRKRIPTEPFGWTASLSHLCKADQSKCSRKKKMPNHSQCSSQGRKNNVQMGGQAQTEGHPPPWGTTRPHHQKGITRPHQRGRPLRMRKAISSII